VIEVTTLRGIGPDDLRGVEPEDVRVLLKTRNSRLWGNPEFQRDYVGVTAEGATYLVKHGVKVLGVDYLSVEEFRKPGAPAHHILLGGGTIVIEGLDLRGVEPGAYELFCLPLRIVGADGAPARVVLRRS
jgi:arylformamidase